MTHALRALALATVLPLVAIGAPAQAKGCIKGAIVGGAVGHVAGKHGFAGAAAGCAVGHHRATVKDREKAAAQANADRGTTANDTQRTAQADQHASAPRRD